MADYLKPNAKVNAFDKSAYTDFDLSFKAHPITGDISIKRDSDAIKRSVKNIILTNKYERPFKPNFGTGIRDLLFELNTSRQIRKMQKRMVEMIETFEPRVSGVLVEVRRQDNNEIYVNVYYNIVNGLQNQSTDFTVTRVR
jgi:phage baseplate assembly protein W